MNLDDLSTEEILTVLMKLAAKNPRMPVTLGMLAKVMESQHAQLQALKTLAGLVKDLTDRLPEKK